VIRTACEADVPAITAIQNHYITTTHIHFATSPVSDEEALAEWAAARGQHPWLVVVDDTGGVLGFARASAWKSRCAYAWSVETSVYLRPEACGRGLGRALYDRLFRILRAQGYRTAIAGIALPNEASIRLHEAVGMSHVGTFRRVGYKLGGWWDVGYWQTVLVDPGSPPAPLKSLESVLADPPRFMPDA
jgi:phosphinothricin acetyltransferase